MQQNIDTINLEYQPTNTVSLMMKMVAITLVILLFIIPMSEFIQYSLPLNLKTCTYGIAGTCGCTFP